MGAPARRRADASAAVCPIRSRHAIAHALQAGLYDRNVLANGNDFGAVRGFKPERKSTWRKDMGKVRKMVAAKIKHKQNLGLKKEKEREFEGRQKAFEGRHANMSVHAVRKSQKRKMQKSQKEQEAELSSARKAKKQGGAYQSTMPTLLLGEGDFSFAGALAMLWRDAGNLIATAYDEEEEAVAKYSGLPDNIATVSSCGGATLFGVDATQCHKHKILKRMAGGFERIIFQFPHLGTGEKDQNRNIKMHQNLLRDTFLAAKLLLAPPPLGELHITLKKGEPYNSWSVVTIGKMCGLRVKHCTPFVPAKFPGYAHRRSIGDDHAGDETTFFKEVGARTYAFELKEERHLD